ncbi:group 1 glycosyl transferase [Psychromonas sp. CNPT3]|nr:group 1 glycosyl transferase [Psychromonas sp. CNPT3]
MMRSKRKILVAFLYRYSLRFCLFFYHCLFFIIKKIKIKDRPRVEKSVILVTGTFYSDHWLMTHLQPMANANNCASVLMVSSTVVPEMHNVKALYAPLLLQKILGKVGARLCYFCWLSFRLKPDVLVGFHLLLNGLLVAILARCIAAKSIYICGGGPREVMHGGLYTENRLFKHIGKADLLIESLLIKAVNEMHVLITMGTSAQRYFQEKGIKTQYEIIAGGFDECVFKVNNAQPQKYDLILIGRLSQVKRVDRFLKALQKARETLPSLNAVIVGDGPQLAQLKQLSLSLGLGSAVDFVGWQNNIEDWLQQSRCFVLTSDSEGLSQALIQAMLTGLPAITSDVGDLSDLVSEEENGYLITSLSSSHFSQAFVHLFSHQKLFEQFSEHARICAKKYSITNVTLQWQEVLQTLSEKNQ